MACKPVSTLSGHETRQAAWDAIRELGTFTVRQVREATTLKMDTVREYLTGLAAAKYIVRLTCDGPAKYQLTKDVGVEAPRVRRDGTPVTQGQGCENMWNAMRIMRVFTARELAVAACTPDCSVKESTAVDYAMHLCRAGYLSKRPDGHYVMPPRAWTGPLAPMIQRVKQVWDPNQRKVRWRSDATEVSDDQ